MYVILSSQQNLSAGEWWSSNGFFHFRRRVIHSIQSKRDKQQLYNSSSTWKVVGLKKKAMGQNSLWIYIKSQATEMLVVYQPVSWFSFTSITELEGNNSVESALSTVIVLAKCNLPFLLGGGQTASLSNWPTAAFPVASVLALLKSLLPWCLPWIFGLGLCRTHSAGFPFLIEHQLFDIQLISPQAPFRTSRCSHSLC